MPVIEITDFTRDGWTSPDDIGRRARWCCERLEAGEILFFRQLPLEISKEDRHFLCGLRQSPSGAVKNISYDLNTGRVAGQDPESASRARLQRLFRELAASIHRFVGSLLAPYEPQLEVDLMSFRPIEEHGRSLPIRSRNDLIHVDAFPNRPARDRRILRFFANLNPTKPRVWKIADINFELLAQRLALDAGLGKILPSEKRILRPLKRLAREVMRYGGYQAAKYSPYDKFMLRFHDYLKLNPDFQDGYPKNYFEFPAGSAWVLFSDMVPHAAISGQHALEQTFFLPVSSMLCPEKSPLRILEAIGSRALV